MEPKAKARLSFAAAPVGASRDAEAPSREPFDRDASDLELLGRFHTGDHAAFAALLGRYQAPIYNFLLRSLAERQAAEDLTQEVFLRVIQGSAGFQSQAKFSTWLFTIARNLCVDHGRRMRHRRHASLEGQASEADGDPPVRLLDRLPHQQPGTERHASSARIRERVGRAVSELPNEQREVFLLRQVDGVSFAEIAVICGIPENTVKSRMRYALERLQKALSDYEDDAIASS
jgi:RNA polymerase sigma-70 factor, ECF subfamily